jgi:hypothetical protein
MKIKFVWNGIKVNGKLYRVWYNEGELIGGRYPDGTLTIYRKDYREGRFPDVPGITVHNNSDMMTDYFESDRIRITPDSQHYAAVVDAIKQSKVHNAKRYAAAKERIESRRIPGERGQL